MGMSIFSRDTLEVDPVVATLVEIPIHQGVEICMLGIPFTGCIIPRKGAFFQVSLDLGGTGGLQIVGSEHGVLFRRWLLHGAHGRRCLWSMTWARRGQRVLIGGRGGWLREPFFQGSNWDRLLEGRQ